MSGMILIPAKQAGATRKVSFDFISDLGVAETISTAVVTATVWSGTDATPSAILAGACAIYQTQAIQFITAGTPGTIYKLVCTITTSLGQTLTMMGYLTISEEPLSGVAPGSSASTAIPAGLELLAEKAATLLLPVTGDEFTLLQVNEAARLTRLVTVLRGGTSPSVAFTLYYGLSRATGTAIKTGGFTTTSITTGDVTTSFTNPNIPDGAFVWAVLGAVTGTPEEFNMTLSF